MRNTGAYYYEKQREKWWVWAVMIGVNLIFVVGCILQIGFERPFGDNPMNDTGLIITSVVIFFISLLVLSGNLQTYINREGIFVRYSPYHFKYLFYAWKDISHVYVRNYHPFREFGGWGMRLSPWHLTGKTVHFTRNIAYSVGGNTGLQIELKNGKKILVGTQQPDKLNRMLVTLGKISE